VQSRQPATLFIDDTKSIVLSTDSRADTGHAIFHANAGASIACASCHLEGSDDGRAWSFDNTVGARRTQSLRGGISGTEPFHWDGDQTDFPALMTEVFGSRMAGPTLTDPQLAANVHWIDQIPLIPQAAGDIMAVARGKALFEDANNVGCVTCHNGPKLTNNLTVDVGTGARFQVARLVGVAQHAPFLHDGRARTLADRFDPSLGGGEKHGHTAQLSPDQLADLMAYLGSL
jgi:cytochrome c peroxidase